MKPSLIVYNVPNGKTRFAERIAKFYGLKNGGIFSLDRLITQDFVYFIDGPFNLLMGCIDVKSFREVADEINAAIPLTDWFSANIKPERKGEYEVIRATTSSYPSKSRLVFGNYGLWSHTSHSSLGMFPGAFAEMLGTYGDKWRGLSEEPIVID